MVAPWSGFWDRNVFAHLPLVASWLSNAFVRGAVSGVGVITASAGLVELIGAFGLRRRDSNRDEPVG